MPYETNPDVAECYGRDRLLAEIEGLLNRKTPAHVQVIGPEGIGKTLLLRKLAARARGWGRFEAVIEWNLRRRTPTDDPSFFGAMGRVVSEGLAAAGSAHAGWVDEHADLEDFQELLEAMASDGARLLVLMDHLDRAIDEAGIGKELWDNLRDLAQSGALTLVTATPRRLRLHCPKGSRASLFWNIFADPTPVGPLSEEDLEEFLEPLKAAVQDWAPPAQKEFAKQTGRVPILAVELANRLLQKAEQGESVTRSVVTEEADALGDGENDRIAHLWEVAPPPVQAALYEIHKRYTDGDEAVPADAFPEDRLDDLRARGYVAVHASGEVAPGARIMLRYAGRHGASQSELARLFLGAQADVNKKALLQLELDAIPGGDPYLRTDIERAIRDLTPRPVDAIKKLRAFSEEGLKHVLHAEFPDGHVPGALIWGWYHSVGEERGRESATAKRVFPAVESWSSPNEQSGAFPSGRNSHNESCELLFLLTHPKCKGEAKHVTDGTARLLKTIHDVGNYGVHIDDYEEAVPFSMAAALCTLGVELFRRLAAELPTG